MRRDHPGLFIADRRVGDGFRSVETIVSREDANRGYELRIALTIMTHTRNTPASRTVSLAPDTRRMPDRAARAWTERMAVRTLGGGRYAVESQSGVTHVVDLPARRCSCPDHAIRGERCKHLRRVAIEITGRRVAPPGKHAAVCTVCGRETFVAETTRLAVCGNCGFHAREWVRDRETGDRLRVTEVTDRRADEVAIPAADCTVAAYPTNRHYEPDEPVVKAVYPTSGDDDENDENDENIKKAQRHQYAFPLSRLERVEDAGPEEPSEFDVAGSALVAGN